MCIFSYVSIHSICYESMKAIIISNNAWESEKYSLSNGHRMSLTNRYCSIYIRELIVAADILPVHISCEYIVILIDTFCYVFLYFFKLLPITDNHEFYVGVFWEYILIICLHQFKYSFFATDSPDKAY